MADLTRLRRDAAALARRAGLARVWAWCSRWRRVLLPALAIVVSMATVTTLVVLSNRADSEQSTTLVQGLEDDRCIRQFAADASEHRTTLVDAQAQVTVETQRTTARLAEGLIAGLLRDDEAAVNVAVLELASAIKAGDEQTARVARAARLAGASEARLTLVSRASKDDRVLFERLCQHPPE